MAERQRLLKRELAQLTEINGVMDHLIDSIKTTQVNVHKSEVATDHTASLLEKWIRILSQTSFTSEVLRNPKWDGNPEEINDDELDAKLNQEQALLDELARLDAENAALHARLPID